ncbi:hypothetical protein [Lignipirellula cremea]|uniref:Uncharacterized protein n=1 Tax=Lignipirellula cremea TaxID=2528010 RepID=A0A518DMN4_9BACT|nr:hypothetical protein [Lignipirellula cremea]QDU93100.1 hypothetical protein Pla8534_08790 [Lignipirellula cremea]
MDTVFPFGFPGPTAFYLTLLVAVFMIHVLFMNYVLAGSAYLAAHTVLFGSADDGTPLSRILRDWLPFMLSAAITAGIAPLLFLQIVYRENFYTANLLLFYRWMAILPVLIAGFYLLYILKSKRIGHWPFVARAAVGVGAFAGFMFVAWSWVENHLLSVHPDVWVEQYASGVLVYRPFELFPRLALWVVGSFPTMALMLAWQVWWESRLDTGMPTAEQTRGAHRTAMIALIAIVLTSICAGAYSLLMPPAARDVVFSMLTLPYVILSVIGVTLELIAWVPQLRAGRLKLVWLSVATVGLMLHFCGMTVINESTRLAAIDISTRYAEHAASAKIGGRWAFGFFLLLNLGLMAYCIRLTSMRRPPEETIETPEKP